MSVIKGSNGHVFARGRPSAGGTFPIHRQPPRDTHFRPLPTPPGLAPFHLDLKDVIDEANYQKVVATQHLIFHVDGDMGGIKDAMPQELVAKGLEHDLDKAADDGSVPQFMYITGDCVYFNGEIAQYYSQFYEPYELYPKPIFAVPGNHDGENLAIPPNSGTTLDGFLRNFCCQQKGFRQPEAMSSFRTAMTQPNVYWTLLTPMCSIVGLYSNVPEGGQIDVPQQTWLINELKTLPNEIPLMITLHHPLYSADDHHSGSSHMREAIFDACAKAGRYPDMILAGHVHMYERISSEAPGRGMIPQIVTGAGGYHNLHHAYKVDGEKLVTPTQFDAGDDETVTLHKYSDDHHGFLRLEVTSDLIIGRYYEVPRPQEPYSKGNQLLDYWEYEWRTRSWRTNKL